MDWSRYKPTLVRADDALRATLTQAFNGKCGYCERTEAHTIDHFWPRHQHPDKTWDWDNFIVACSVCQGKKHGKSPVNAHGYRMLNPREEEPLTCLRINPDDGKIFARPTQDAREQRGALTITLLHLDQRSDLDRDRRTIYRYVQRLIVRIVHPGTSTDEQAAAWEDLQLLLDPRQHSLAVVQQLFTFPTPEMEPLIAELYRIIPAAYDFFARFRRSLANDRKG
jgi:uncharacterized protein (TIGR02646 family)